MHADLQTTFDQAKHIVFLTGAGVSTASGIPDFRSANGLYNTNQNAEYYLSHRYFAKDPQGFYEFCKKYLYFPDAKPNPIHEKQVTLACQNRATIITQNIDNLYEAEFANQNQPVQNLVDFHGNLYHVYCEKCGQTVSVEQYLTSCWHQSDHGMLRPDIVLYDEGIKQNDIVASVQAMQAADLVVIVGTSMRVYPFAGLLDYRNANAKVVAINQEPLAFNFDFTMVQADATEFFAQLHV